MPEPGAGRREWEEAERWLGTEATGVWVSGSALLLTLATRHTGTSPLPVSWSWCLKGGDQTRKRTFAKFKVSQSLSFLVVESAY